MASSDSKKARHASFDGVHRFYDPFMRTMRLYRERLIAMLLELKGDERVADLGGGTGWVARHLAAGCREIYVLDESPGMLERAARYENVRIVQGNALATPFPSAYFDVVILSDVIHHIADQPGLIDEARRILKRSGRLLIYDFDATHPRAMIARWLESKLVGKVYFQSRSWVEGLLAEKGFEPLKRVTRGHYYIIVWRKLG